MPPYRRARVLTVRGGPPGSVPLIGAAGALIVVACCAGLPLVGAVLGGLTLAAVLGVAGGVLMAGAAIAGALLLLRARRQGARSSATKKVTR